MASIRLTMALIALLALALVWPFLFVPAFAFVATLALKALGPSWTKAVGSALVLTAIVYPLSSGPVMAGNLWLAQHGYTPQGRLDAWGVYRPLFRGARGTSLERPLLTYLDRWMRWTTRDSWIPRGRAT
jgi:hypothetical protein